ncbi:MAG: EMC3/TMCO1 family protein, partial [Nitrosopumilaceae archaeon]
MTPEFSFVLNFLDSIFLQDDLFGLHQGPLGSADPLIKGMLPSALGILGISILLNLFNAVVRRKLVDRVKLKRIMQETRSWQKERMVAFRSKDKERIANLNKKSPYMNKMSMEMMQMNMRPMMITIIPLLLIFYFVLPQMFAYTV